MVTHSNISQQVKVIAPAAELPAAIAPYAGKTGVLERIRTRGGGRYCTVHFNGQTVDDFEPKELEPVAQALSEAA
jgi:hypothetical protein